jgi:3-hydroxyisobutyrate dehydrogenase-like beta-hydroxyacid dehydrogenase
MGDKFFNCGRVGGGLMAKVCNNLALGIEMIGSC